MKRETLDRFLGKDVTIKLFDNKYYKGFLYPREGTETFLHPR